LVQWAVPLSGFAADVSPLHTAEQVLRKALEENYPTVVHWEISALTSPDSIPKEADTAGATVSVTRLGQRSAVWLGSADKSRHRRGQLLWFAVSGYAPVLTASHLIVFAAALTPADGHLQDQDILAAGCQPLVAQEALIDQRARRTLHEGDTICAAAIEPTPAVARGQEVVMHYAGRNLQLTAHAVAQTDGLLGKSVSVRSPSGEIFTATVSGRGEVSVHD
jgi:flagella basal body P-ring formation protein FlgA